MSERARVVAGPRHDLRAEEVRLLLVVAAVAEQQRGETELGAFHDVPAQLAAENLPIASLAPERHIGIDRRGAAGGQVAGEKRGAD
jgi:hypothetical protein